MESTRRQNQVSQTGIKISGKTNIELDPVKDRLNEPMAETLEGISAKEECFHAPNLLIYLGSDYQGDVIVHTYRCSCGKTVKETFAHCHTMAFD